MGRPSKHSPELRERAVRTAGGIAAEHIECRYRQSGSARGLREDSNLTGWWTVHGRHPMALSLTPDVGALLRSDVREPGERISPDGGFVLVTTMLYQVGLSQSKRPVVELVDVDPRDMTLQPDTPWPVRRGGLWLWRLAGGSAASVAPR